MSAITREQVELAVMNTIHADYGDLAMPGDRLDSFGIDSLAAVEIAMTVEETLDVDISGNGFDSGDLLTIRDLINAICLELDL